MTAERTLPTDRRESDGVSAARSDPARQLAIRKPVVPRTVPIGPRTQGVFGSDRVVPSCTQRFLVQVTRARARVVIIRIIYMGLYIYIRANAIVYRFCH